LLESLGSAAKPFMSISGRGTELVIDDSVRFRGGFLLCRPVRPSAFDGRCLPG
jgi:hypothetical protein